jgi:hypothetical protein
VTDWLQIEGWVHALPARRGSEEGTYLWIEAGELHEKLVAEVFVPVITPDTLDAAMGVGRGTVDFSGRHTTGDLTLQFGRVRDDKGIVSLGGLVEVDVRFQLSMYPPGGGFCPFCGAELEVEPVIVITPPDGGLMGTPTTRCTQCGAV